MSNNRELHAWLTARLSCFVVSDEKLDKNEVDGVIDQSTWSTNIIVFLKAIKNLILTLSIKLVSLNLSLSTGREGRWCIVPYGGESQRAFFLSAAQRCSQARSAHTNMWLHQFVLVCLEFKVSLPSYGSLGGDKLLLWLQNDANGLLFFLNPNSLKSSNSVTKAVLTFKVFLVGFPNWHVSGCHFQEQVGWGTRLGFPHNLEVSPYRSNLRPLPKVWTFCLWVCKFLKWVSRQTMISLWRKRQDSAR